jgi:hypothetical protein
MLALIVAPDRVIVSPIPDQVVTDCIIHAGSRLPLSSGFVSSWEGYCLTDWKWEISVTQGFDGRMKREFEGIVLGELPDTVRHRVIPDMVIGEDDHGGAVFAKRARRGKPFSHKSAQAPTGVYCPGLKRVCRCEGVQGFEVKALDFKSVPLDTVAPMLDAEGFQDRVLTELGVPAELLGFKGDKQKERCPYNSSSLGCGANSCGDNPNCPEKT